MKNKSGNIKMFGIVRDSDGNVLLSDYHNIPDHIYKSLTEKDKKYIKEKQRNDNSSLFAGP